MIPRPPPNRLMPPINAHPVADRVKQALEAHQAIRHIEPGFFPGSYRPPARQQLPQARTQAQAETAYGPALHPGVLHALLHGATAAVLAPWHAAPTVGSGMGRELGSARWAYEILHNPWQTRQFIHPRGG